MLSQLERGVGNPSYLTLAKLADALDFPVGYLFAESASNDRFVVRRAERKRLVPAKGEYIFELLTPDLRGPFEMLWIELSPGAPEPEPYVHEGHECVLVVDGILDFHLGAAVIRLETGDSITFPGDLPHRAENPGLSISRLVVTVAPPSF